MFSHSQPKVFCTLKPQNALWSDFYFFFLFFSESCMYIGKGMHYLHYPPLCVCWEGTGCPVYRGNRSGCRRMWLMFLSAHHHTASCPWAGTDDASCLKHVKGKNIRGDLMSVLCLLLRARACVVFIIYTLCSKQLNVNWWSLMAFSTRWLHRSGLFYLVFPPNYTMFECLSVFLLRSLWYCLLWNFGNLDNYVCWFCSVWLEIALNRSIKRVKAFLRVCAAGC